MFMLNFIPVIYTGIFIINFFLIFLFQDLLNVLTDLTTNSFETTHVQSQWVCFTSNSEWVSSCSVYHVLGGYNILGSTNYCQTSFNSLRPHYSLSISLTFLKIDNWNSNHFLIYIDTIQQYSSLSLSSTDDASQKLCSTTNTNDAIRSFSLNKSHTSTSAVLKFTSDLAFSATQASWGIRDVIINIDSCHYSCSSCSGPASTQCTSCLTNADFISPGVCNCNNNYYMNLITPCLTYPCASCAACNSLCKTCSGDTSSHCLSCYVGTYLYNNNCLNNCPDGFFNDQSTLICQTCNINCKTCSNTASNCLSCYTSTYLQNNVCVSECLAGYYGDINSLQCKFCSSLCSLCSKLSGNCTACSYPLYLNPGNICLNNCPSGMWKNSGTNKCENCLSPCVFCSDSASSCTKCDNPYFLFGSSCLSTCPYGTFEDLSSRKCLSCSSQCSSCVNSSDTCTLCDQNYVLDNFQCLTSCTYGRYFSSTAGQCLDCDSRCLTCDKQSTICTSCKNQMVLLQDFSCATSCPQNQFADSNEICQTCDSKCSSCTKSSSYCLTCSDETLYADDGNCITHCSDNKYPYELNKQCFSCNETCNGCFGSQANQCIDCFIGYNFYKFHCYSTCPDKTFPENGNCSGCEKNCVHCVDSVQCSICDTNYYLNNSVCMIKRQISASFFSIINPFSFKIIFGGEIIADDIEIILSEITSNISGSNGRKIDYNLNKEKEDLIIYLEFIYSEPITANNTNITFTFNEQINENFYITLYNNTFNLNTFSVCCTSSNSYYDQSSKKCQTKNSISFSLIYSDDPTVYSLRTRGLSSDQVIHVTDIFQVLISNHNFIYDFSYGGSNIFSINFIFHDYIIGGPQLVIKKNVSLEYNILYHIIWVNEMATIKMTDCYQLSSNEQSISASTNDMSLMADIFNQCNLYINIVLNGQSSFLIQGLMLLNLINILKYISINYPPNVISMFNVRKSNGNMFGLPEINIDETDSLVLPQIFIQYEVSEYYLNNEGSFLCQVLTIVIIDISLLFMWKVYKTKFKSLPHKKYSKYFIGLLKWLKKIFIWPILFNYIFSKYQLLVFYTFTCFKFQTTSKPKGEINVFFAVISGIFIIFMPFHIYKLSRKMRKIHNNKFSKVTPVSSASDVEPKLKSFEIFRMDSKSPETKKGIEENFQSIENIKADYSNQHTPKLRVISTILKNISINPVEITDSDICKDQWKHAMTPQKQNLPDIHEEDAPNSQEFQETNIGTDIQTKLEQGRMKISEYKALSYIFNGNFSEVPNSAIMTEKSTKRNIELTDCQPTVIKKPKEHRMLKQMTMFLSLLNKLCIVEKLKKYYIHLYGVERCNDKQFIKRYSFLSNDFKNNNILQELYLFFDFLRHYLLASTVVIFFGYPLFQIIIISCLNIIFYMIMIVGRPFKNKYLMILTFINETLVNFALMSAILLAVYDETGNKDTTKRQLCGWFIIFANVFLMYSLVLTTLAKIYVIVRSSITCKKNKSNKINQEAPKIDSENECTNKKTENKFLFNEIFEIDQKPKQNHKANITVFNFN